MKRALDIVLGTVGLVLAAPVILAGALAVRRRAPGPLLYAHERAGRDGRPFLLWKVRTMVDGGDALLEARLRDDPAARVEWDRYFRLADDPRIAGRAGRLLRRLSIDELPQLYNVIVGDMSLVGPRPLPPDVIAALPPPFVAARQVVRPGLTGLWQVSGRSDVDLAAMEATDLAYVERASLALDLRILARTPRAVLTGEGAY
ncbi:MAG: sugar transferase [Solirubrobacteraceae bacterium]|nr:sugar transferase [Solirubrobacteraceae bacterium]